MTVNTTLPARHLLVLDWSSGGTPGVRSLGAAGDARVGQPPGERRRSLAGAAFAPAIDTSSGAVQDFPFVIEGQTAGGGGPSISLRKTVGTTPGVCGDQQHQRCTRHHGLLLLHGKPTTAP